MLNEEQQYSFSPLPSSPSSSPCRFAKNLSPDKINLSTLKGEGQLTNLELDEEVLQSMLDLPTWLAINKVGCNKAAIRVRERETCAHTCTLGGAFALCPSPQMNPTILVHISILLSATSSLSPCPPPSLTPNPTLSHSLSFSLVYIVMIAVDIEVH